jgi:hypothetical protein
MFIETDRGRINFSFDKYVGHWASIFDLALWSNFQSDYSRPDLKGTKVLLILQDAHEHEDLKYSWEHFPCYVKCLHWFLQNEREIQKSALFAIEKFISSDLRAAYGEQEIEEYLNGELHQMIDLSHVRFYPESKDNSPYFGLEFECNWDPEHGCGLIYSGSQVLMTGQAEVANAYLDLEYEGAYVKV